MASVDRRTRVARLKFYFSLALLIFLVPGLFIMGARTIFDPGRFGVFNQSGLAATAVQIWGVYTIVGALLMAHPRTFVIGNALLLLNNLFIIGLHIRVENLRGAALEALSVGLPIFMLWAGHPYDHWKNQRGTSASKSQTHRENP